MLVPDITQVNFKMLGSSKVLARNLFSWLLIVANNYITKSY